MWSGRLDPSEFNVGDLRIQVGVVNVELHYFTFNLHDVHSNMLHLLIVELCRSFGSSVCRKESGCEVLFDAIMPPKSDMKLSEFRAAARAAEKNVNRDLKTLFNNTGVKAVVRYLGQVDPTNQHSHN